jgi:hypothetical protein
MVMILWVTFCLTLQLQWHCYLSKPDICFAVRRRCHFHNCFEVGVEGVVHHKWYNCLLVDDLVNETPK